jgi:hypothetical protein
MGKLGVGAVVHQPARLCKWHVCQLERRATPHPVRKTEHQDEEVLGYTAGIAIRSEAEPEYSFRVVIKPLTILLADQFAGMVIRYLNGYGHGFPSKASRAHRSIASHRRVPSSC